MEIQRLLFRGMLLRLAAAGLVAVALAGCGDGDDDAPPVVTPSTTLPAPAPTLGDAGLDPVTSTAAEAETSLLTGLRAAGHPGYDRVVFEFGSSVPGYDIRYVERPVRADGSGNKVAVAGAAVLLVRMEPALDADLSQESAPRTYTGPTRFSPATARVAELVRVGGFEAVLTWAIGVDGEAPFLVTQLENPARLVIDVAAE